mgnify:CR=1 FL=1
MKLCMHSVDIPILSEINTTFLTLQHADQVVFVHLQSSRPCQRIKMERQKNMKERKEY